VADGFWIIATEHYPGGSRQVPAINNRCLVFRVVESGDPRLLVINGVDASAIAEVRRLEHGTGRKEPGTSTSAAAASGSSVASARRASPRRKTRRTGGWIRRKRA
jgi:hypothetical protein